MLSLTLTFAMLAIAVEGAVMGTYYADWSKYHLAPYTYTPDLMAPLAPHVDELMSVEPSDTDFLATLNGYKTVNPQLRLVLSVGGWNFPSSYYSAMASTAANRAIFVNSVLSWIHTSSADGVDLDWEYPCSAPRSDPVEISCTQFQTVVDTGGNCPADTTNIVLLLEDLSAALFPLNKTVSIASQAAKTQEDEMNIIKLHPYISYFNVMSYDYAVSDIPGSNPFSPNAPLYTPSDPRAVQMSINYTISNYLAAGVPPSKIMVGFPLYGHSWFNPTLNASTFAAWGGPTYVQGACCGVFATTGGGKPGQGAQQCGTMMYSEVMAAIGDPATTTALMHYDEETQSNIVYFPQQGADGATTAGTWVTYNDARSAVAVAKYANDLGLRGVFIFDSSMDSMVGTAFTYDVSLALAKALGA